jgi:hypothetical protein
MKSLFEITLQNRKNLAYLMDHTPRAQLLRIPEGHRNNIWWNIAHVVVSQQGLVYNLSKLPLNVSEELVGKYRKGTVPDGTASEEEIQTIRDILLSTIEQTREDYQNERFEEYVEYTTSARVTLRNVEDAIAFNLFHEGLHMAVILALQKKVGA